jgi:hypothetical protein
MLKKILIALCLGAFIIAAMGAGCKKKEEPEKKTDETPTEEGTE